MQQLINTRVPLSLKYSHFIYSGKVTLKFIGINNLIIKRSFVHMKYIYLKMVDNKFFFKYIRIYQKNTFQVYNVLIKSFLYRVLMTFENL